MNIEVTFQVDADMYVAEVEINGYLDFNHGADADGNRGIKTELLEIGVVYLAVVNRKGGEREIIAMPDYLVEEAKKQAEKELLIKT